MPMSPYTYMIAAVDLAARADKHPKKQTCGAEPAKVASSITVAAFRCMRDYGAATAITLLLFIVLTCVAFTLPSKQTEPTIYDFGRGSAGGDSRTFESLNHLRQESNHWLLEQYERIDRGDLENVEGLDGIGDYRVQNYRIATPEQRVALRAKAEAAIAKKPSTLMAQRASVSLLMNSAPKVKFFHGEQHDQR